MLLGVPLWSQWLELHLPMQRGAGSIPSQGAGIPHASRTKNKQTNIKQNQYCNKFNKDLKKWSTLEKVDITIFFGFVSKSCLTLATPWTEEPGRLLFPWDSTGENTEVGCHVPSPGVLPNPEIEPGSPALQADSLLTELQWKPTYISSVQFSSVAQSCLTLCNPMNLSPPGLPVHHKLLEFTQTHAHRVSDAIQPSHPLSSPSPPAPNPSQHQGLFQWVNSSH